MQSVFGVCVALESRGRRLGNRHCRVVWFGDGCCFVDEALWFSLGALHASGKSAMGCHEAFFQREPGYIFSHGLSDCRDGFFTSTGARQGDTILAVNTLLMQLITLFSYIMDGFAYAGEALVGRYIGACNVRNLRHAVRNLFGWGVGL